MRSSEEIAAEILRRIRVGAYLPGDSLSQYELAKEFQISRTPVREALRFLEARRAISLSASGRAIVDVPSLKAVREAFEIRAELEGLATRMSVDWLSDADLQALAVSQSHYASSTRSRVRGEGGADWVEHNDDFHRLIAKASRNDRLQELISELQGGSVAAALNFAAIMPPRLMEENIQQHEDIIAALNKRDGVAAGQAMVNHVLKSMALVLDWLARRSP